MTVTRYKVPRGPVASTPSPALPDKELKAALKAIGGRSPGARRQMSVSRLHDDMVPGMRWPVRTLAAVDFIDCDLAGADIRGGLFSRVSIEDCRFERVRLDPFDGDKLDIVSTRFVATEFAGHTNAPLTNSTIRKSEFERCDIRGMLFVRCVIDDVSFLRPKTNRTAFRRSTMTDVRFIGRTTAMFFVDSRLDRVDFRACDADDLIFSECELIDVRFPTRRNSFVVLTTVFHEIAGGLLSD